MYQLTSGDTILRLSDNAFIPTDPGNRDYRESYNDCMGKPLRDLTGQSFGSLTALCLGEKLAPGTGVWWECQCICGTRKSIRSRDLVSGKVNSCGCQKTSLKRKASTRHGMKGTRTYRIWQAMKSRCSNPNASSYANYGGRGISICPQWESFEGFLADMGKCPEGMSIDRIDTNGNYTAENCRWATRSEQANNTRANVVIEYQDKKMTRTQWERELGLGATTLRGRIRAGASLEKALQPLEV